MGPTEMLAPASDGSSYLSKHFQAGKGVIWGKYPGSLRALSPEGRGLDVRYSIGHPKGMCIRGARGRKIPIAMALAT